VKEEGMSQDLSTLRNFFAFGRWANRTILESAAVLNVGIGEGTVVVPHSQ
jgi:hypothetical protein